MNNKVYVLLETFYNYDGGEEAKSVVCGVYENEEKAKKILDIYINDNIENFGFVKDEQEGTRNTIIFWDYQENWSNYIEYEIIEKIIE